MNYNKKSHNCILQHSFENARLALGGTLDLVDLVLKDEVRIDIHSTENQIFFYSTYIYIY